MSYMALNDKQYNLFFLLSKQSLQAVNRLPESVRSEYAEQLYQVFDIDDYGANCSHLTMSKTPPRYILKYDKEQLKILYNCINAQILSAGATCTVNNIPIDYVKDFIFELQDLKHLVQDQIRE